VELCIVAKQFYEYSSVIKGHSKDTIKKYKYAIERYSALASISTIDQVSEATLRHFFLVGRTQLGWKASTYITIHKALTVFLSWCLKQGYISANPILQVEKPKLEKRLPYSLSKTDALRLLEVVQNLPYKHRFDRFRNHALFAVALYAGLRKQELLRLRYIDVSIENRSIFIFRGKGSKDRIIPMTSTLTQILSTYLTERKRLNKTCPEFFTSTINNAGYSDTALKRIVNEIRVASRYTFSMHKLRHTFATLMIEGGCDIFSLSKMMGHADITTTTIYLSASTEHLRSQMMKHPLDNETKFT